MSWDPTWERVFRSREWGRYPPEELIRFVARNYYAVPNRQDVRLLELGCGPGANIWYLAREGFTVHGVDASETAISKARERLAGESLEASLAAGDIARLSNLYSDIHFDAIIDVTCLQCNRAGAVKRIVDQAFDLLKEHGRFFGIMLAEGSYGWGTGTEVEPGTLVDINEGPLKGAGLNHFFTLAELGELFRRFAGVRIEYSVRSMNDRRDAVKHWVVEALKNP